MGSKIEAIGLKIGMDLTIIGADGVALLVFWSRARSAHIRTRSAQKGDFTPFLGSPCILEQWSIKHIMLSIIFWTSTEIFMQIGPWGGAKRGTYNTFLALFQSDGVLETSEAALDAFWKMTVSFKQAKRHSTLFQRLRCASVLSIGTEVKMGHHTTDCKASSEVNFCSGKRMAGGKLDFFS